MPFIPRLKPTGPLGNVPAPVLDRERRPTVDKSAEIRAVGALGQASQMPDIKGDFGAEYRGLGAVGEAIAKAGGVVTAAAIKEQEAKTHVQLADADATMEGELNKHAAWRVGKDTSLWEENLRSGLASAKSSIMGNPNLTPGAKAQLGSRIDRFTGLSLSQMEVDRRKTVFKEAALSYDATTQRFMTAKNYPAALANVKEKVKNAYGYDIEIAAAENDIENAKKRDALEARQAENLMKSQQLNVAKNLAVSVAANRGEEAALKDLEDGKYGADMPPIDKEQVRNAIQQVSRDRSASLMDSISTGILSGQISNTAAIDSFESPFMTPKLKQEAKEFLKRYNAFEQQQDREQNGVRNAVEMRQRVKDYQPSKDPDRTEYFRLLHEIGSRVEQSSAGEITGELYKKYGTTPPKAKVRPEIQQNVSKSLDILFDPEKGAIPWRSKDDLTGKVTEDLPAKQRALDAQTVIELRMADWFKENPQDGQSLPKVQAKLQELLPEGTRAAALDSMMKLMVPKTTKADDLRGFIDSSDLKDKLPDGLKGHAQDFIDAAREYNLNPRVLAAISALETGGGTSKAFREKLNAMGISDDSGPLSMSSVRDSIFRQAKTLARVDGPYAGAKTLDAIGKIYAPPGAANDFKGTNDGWAENVRAWLARL